MMRLLRILVSLGLVLLALLSWAPQEARAADEDVVRNLEVTYDVRPDGSVHVRYSLDWQFAERGRHGIELSLVTAEPWDDDPLQEAVYEISDLEVSSPSGVPTDLEAEENEGSGTLDLRIGDPDVALAKDRATYVLTYELRGAMRTFDGKPQFYWDVTSDDFPKIDAFTVTVNGPSDVPRARCLQGSTECRAEVSGRTATLRGGDVSRYQPVSVVSEFEAGSVRNAEPKLRPRDLPRPVLLDRDTTVTVGADGVAEVVERVRVKPGSSWSRVNWQLPLRRPHSQWRDRRFDVRLVGITDADEIPLYVERSVDAEGRSRERVEIEATLPDDAEDADAVELTARFRIEGAVTLTESGTAVFALPIDMFESRGYRVPTEERVTWNLPTEVTGFSCRLFSRLDDPKDGCSLGRAAEVTSEADSVSYRQRSENGYGPADWMVIEFAGAGVTPAPPVLEWSESARATGILGTVIGLPLIFPPLGWLLSRVRLGRARDERYVGLPPGVIGTAGEVGRARPYRNVPVRFSPPDASPLEIGVLLDRRSKLRHLSSTLINMAASGAVGLRLNPLALWKLDAERLASPFERSLFNVARVQEGRRARLNDRDKRSLNKSLQAAVRSTMKDGELFRPLPTFSLSTVFWVLVSVLVAAAGVAASMFLGGVGWTIAGFVAVALLWAGLAFGLHRRPGVLTARGTALLEQAHGFRQYLRTAESQHLDADAGSDLYRRNLAWAVLFDEVDRWTKACEVLADRGEIARPDPGFIAGVHSAGQLSSELRTFRAAVTPTPTSSSGGGGGGWSSGGSGSSSGFSGGAVGGGGGGGTSAGSW